MHFKPIETLFFSKARTPKVIGTLNRLGELVKGQSAHSLAEWLIIDGANKKIAELTSHPEQDLQGRPAIEDNIVL